MFLIGKSFLLISFLAILKIHFEFHCLEKTERMSSMGIEQLLYIFSCQLAISKLYEDLTTCNKRISYQTIFLTILIPRPRHELS